MADTNKTHLVDLTLLNAAYSVNKKRLDNLRTAVYTESLEATSSIKVGTTTTNGSLTVNSGTLTTDTLSVTGGMTVNGGGAVLPEGKALSLKNGGSVTGTTTLDSLTGSVKFGNAVNSNGVVTGSAQIVIPTNKSLSLSGSAVTNANTTIEGVISASTTSVPVVSGTLSATDTKTTKDTTIEGIISASTTSKPVVSGTLSATDTKTTSATTITGTINSADISVSGSAVLDGSTLQTTTIKNGTIDLNSKTLTVTDASTITTITEGDKTTIEGVGGISAKSMTLAGASTDSIALNITSKYGSTATDSTKVALYCAGGITGARVFNAVWNDLADAIEVPSDTELEYGYCYKYKEGQVYKTDSYADANILGIHSDTAGMVLGTKNPDIKCIKLAVAGVVLAYVDKEYECGTALVATKEGKLTKANRRTRILHPERIVATFYKTEARELWGTDTCKVKVNGRSWVKVK